MAIIFKPFFEILTGDVAICNNWLYNYAFLAIVGELAYQFAYGAVGDLYSSGMIHGRAAGSAAHWTIRLFIYVGLAYLLRALIWIYNFIVSVPIQVWLVLLGLLVVGIVIFIVYRVAHRDTV